MHAKRHTTLEPMWAGNLDYDKMAVNSKFRYKCAIYLNLIFKMSQYIPTKIISELNSNKKTVRNHAGVLGINSRY